MGSSSEKIDLDARLALILLRSSTFLDQTDFAATARIARTQLGSYERGERSVPWKVLERAADAAGFPGALLLLLLQSIKAYRLLVEGWSRGQSLLLASWISVLLELVGEALKLLTAPRAKPQPVSLAPSLAREAAQEVWLLLERRTPRQRRLLLEEVGEYRTFALVERLAAESIAVAAKSPSAALELAELAVRTAELCPGEEGLRLRAQGYAWFHVCNARKASSDLKGAEKALAKAAKLWGAGTPEEGFFRAPIALALEAMLHYVQRRFDLALRRIEEALAADPGDLQGRLLLNKAQFLDALGDSQGSCEALREAGAYLDEQRDPRTALGVRYQLVANLCLANRAPEAAAGLPAVRALAERLGQDLDLVRVVWLSGAIAAGCGRLEEAEAAFKQAREAFAKFEPPIVFDYALLSLELAIVLLKQGRTVEVRPLAEDLVKLFKSQGVLPEALAAVQLYYEAARREAATLELTQQVIRFLHRAQHDPDLKFEIPGTAERP